MESLTLGSRTGGYGAGGSSDRDTGGAVGVTVPVSWVRGSGGWVSAGWVSSWGRVARAGDDGSAVSGAGVGRVAGLAITCARVGRRSITGTGVGWRSMADTGMGGRAVSSAGVSGRAISSAGGGCLVADGARAVGDGQGGGLGDSVGLAADGELSSIWADGGVVLDDLGDVGGLVDGLRGRDGVVVGDGVGRGGGRKGNDGGNVLHFDCGG